MKDAPIIELDTIDSTNNYAMQLIDADTALPGLTIIAGEQTQGKGQRGRQWQSQMGQNLLMSIIVAPESPLDEQFSFNAAIAVAIAEVLQGLNEHWSVYIKWPNDMIINDKKTGGILIENVLRGSAWMYSIIGLGLNVLQNEFPDDLPNATSLKAVSGKNYDIPMLVGVIRDHIFKAVTNSMTSDHIMKIYNEYLYRRGRQQVFSNEQANWSATILHAGKDGKLNVQLEDGSLASYNHGTVQWVW